MLAKHELVQPPQPIAPLPTLDLNRAIDSIFIIQSLLIAIAKECVISIETDKEISKLKQEITFLENIGHVTNLNFSYIDSQFYFLLSNANGFQRLATIISKEKSHIDRFIRLFVRRQESYKLIINAYKNVLHGIQIKNATTATSALFNLGKIIKEHMLTAEENYPEFFNGKDNCK